MVDTVVPFDQRQQVALHALARHVGALRIGAAGHLVDLVEEDDAVLLDGLDRLQLHFLVIDQAGGFLVGQQLQRLADLQLARLLLAAAHVLEHALDLLGQFLHARRREDLGLHARRGDFDVDFLVVQLALTQLLAEFLAGRIFRRAGLAVLGEETRAARRRQQRIEHALLGRILGARPHRLHRPLAARLDGHLDQVADDGFDIAADVADLGELGRLDLDEGRIGQAGQAAGNLGLADAGRADHQDVLGGDLLAQRLGHLGTPPAVAQGDGHRLLGGLSWPTMCLSSSETISCGVIWVMSFQRLQW